jgi:glutathione S-transferase
MAHREGKSPDEEMKAKAEEALQFLEKFLEDQDWVAGNSISIADYSIIAVLLMTDVRKATQTYCCFDITRTPSQLNTHVWITPAVFRCHLRST